MSPGSRWVFSRDRHRGQPGEGGASGCSSETKRIANGVEALVVRDTATENGVPVEITDDWYAQDDDGNIWYLGEYITNYENGKPVDHAGSFEAGVDGAEPGVAMPADPEPGMTYRQEYYAGEAEDKAAIVTVGEEHVEVPFGFFDKDVLMTRDLVPTGAAGRGAEVLRARASGHCSASTPTAPEAERRWSATCLAASDPGDRPAGD